VLDAVVISDLHLGSANCQAKSLCQFLDGLIGETGPRTRRLILNGDVFDSIDYCRLRKRHWRVLSHLRKLSDRIEIVWIRGNHDMAADVVSPLLGVEVHNEYVLESGDRRLLFVHGHAFDEFLGNYPVLTWLADVGYRFLQIVDPSHWIARQAKRRSKTFLRCAEKVARQASELAQKRGCDTACCGHTHQPRAERGGAVGYFNSGCWTERPSTYLTVENGWVEVKTFTPAEVESSAAEETELEPAGV
jgi:UDP-2,3-diacylglucosamine pyrophosphatase LpxH